MLLESKNEHDQVTLPETPEVGKSAFRNCVLAQFIEIAKRTGKKHRCLYWVLLV